ncbi:hypothetical protein VFPFJ_06397 [Purpureocillium lilacinum]|uniref:Uncharacterized protein n=1 Tax=Purpureocillium lilacinum TaxID=33203 RepID=A0A179HKS6_PURLI|nr:hypothetical protein VFPFJ_06397 [Purpureocillium lilacinum]OAQ89983.1 hypothetical protein VFPFJ_06397 [Purpureocillium lilacinum]
MASLIIALAVGGRHLYLVHKDKKLERRQRRLMQQEGEGHERDTGTHSNGRASRKRRAARRATSRTDGRTEGDGRRDSQETLTRNRPMRDEDSASRLSEQSTLAGDDQPAADGVHRDGSAI